MSNINLHPLFRRSIGFDRLNDFIDYAMQSDAPNYPPYNIEKHGENHYRISARMLIDDVNDLFGLDIDNENVDTMGGWLLDQKYDVKEGEEIEYHGYRFKAIQKEKNSIIVIDIFTTKKMKNQVESADSEENEEPEVTE